MPRSAASPKIPGLEPTLVTAIRPFLEYYREGYPRSGAAPGPSSLCLDAVCDLFKGPYTLAKVSEVHFWASLLSFRLSDHAAVLILARFDS